MIGDLLKKLVVGLWRYSLYHLGRLTGLRSLPPAPQPSGTPLAVPPMAGSGVRSSPGPQNLTDAYLSPVRWTTNRQDIDDEALASNPVFQHWRQLKPRAHKWSHYFEVYHAIFGERRTQALRILEIGVFQGASLRMWRRYFNNPATVLVGVDIDPTCARFDAPQEKVHVRIGSQNDAEFLKGVSAEFGPFDIIIDDGSHHSSHLIASFNLLFADALRDDGIYVAEDLHTTYWIPWRDTPSSFFDLCRELIELMHVHYDRALLHEWSRESEAPPGSEPFSMDVPRIATMIKEIRFFDSIVSIQKTRRLYMPRVLHPDQD